MSDRDNAFHVYWRIPMSGDMSSWRNAPKTRGDWTPTVPGSLAPGVRDGERDGTSYLDYMLEVARAAEQAGFYGGLLPSFPQTDDPWIASAALARATTTFRFMVAFQPGFLDPVETARMSATLQRISGGRLVYNVITGGGGPEQRWWGDFTAHDDRYARTSEFLDVLKGVWNGGRFDYDGRFYHVRDGGLRGSLAGRPAPDLYFSGSSDAAIDAASAHADYYLSWLEHPADLERKFDRVRARAAERGRVARFAVRAHVVARPTAEEAWREVRLGWLRVTPERIELLRNRKAESIGAARLAAYQPNTPNGYEDLILAPNIWSGIGLLGDFPTIGIVGSYEQVAERLDDLVRIGADALILAGLPHLEEAYRVGEEVLPLFRGRAAVAERVLPASALAV
jgi:alkanesulfonate monooxygenase